MQVTALWAENVELAPVATALRSICSFNLHDFGTSCRVDNDGFHVVMYSDATQFVLLTLNRNATCTEMKEQIEVAIIQHLIAGE